MREMNRWISKIMVCIIVMVQIIGTSWNITFARVGKEENDNMSLMSDGICINKYKELSKNESVINRASDAEEHIIKTNINGYMQEKRFKMHIEDNEKSNAKYRYDVENIDILNEEDHSVEFEVVSDEKAFGNMKIYAEYEDGTTAQKAVYTYTRDNKVYLSESSRDAALYNFLKEKYDAGILSEEECMDEYSEFAQSLMEEYVPTEDEISDNACIALLSLDDATTVYGTLRWELEDGTRLPLRQVKVELLDKDSVGAQIIATTYTDNNGYFSFTFDNPDEWYEFESGGIDAFVRCYASSYTFGVNKDIGFCVILESHQLLKMSVREHQHHSTSILSMMKHLMLLKRSMFIRVWL